MLLGVGVWAIEHHVGGLGRGFDLGNERFVLTVERGVSNLDAIPVLDVLGKVERSVGTGFPDRSL